MADEEEPFLTKRVYKSEKFSCIARFRLHLKIFKVKKYGKAKKRHNWVSCLRGTQTQKEQTANLAPNHTYFFTFYINHTPIIPPHKSIEACACSATNPKTLPRKLKMTPPSFPTIASHASAALVTSLLTASASLFKHFFEVSSSFGGYDKEAAALPLFQKAPVIARTFV